jgi:hypothetical protein
LIQLGTWTSRYWTYATFRYSVLDISVLGSRHIGTEWKANRYFQWNNNLIKFKNLFCIFSDSEHIFDSTQAPVVSCCYLIWPLPIYFWGIEHMDVALYHKSNCIPTRSYKMYIHLYVYMEVAKNQNKIFPVVIAIKSVLGKNKSSWSWIFRGVIGCINHCCLTSREHYFALLFQWPSTIKIWSSTKRTSSSSHWKLTCSRHNITENLLSWH